MLKTFNYRAQFLLLQTCLWAVRLFPLAWRAAAIGFGARILVRCVPSIARRGRENLRLIYPDMSRADQTKFLSQVASNIGRTLTEIWFNNEFAQQLDRITVSGPGLEALGAAKAQGRGAIIVSAHFGQWEAIRHLLKARGMEAGAIYRPNNNPYYERLFRHGIEQGGAPIIARGPSGNRGMLRHLRNGGFFALLSDQYDQSGALLTFMDQPAVTATGAAGLALRFDLPLVPAFARRIEGSDKIHIIFQDPIPHSDPETMMQTFNDRLAAQIHEAPTQWYWLHQRWKVFDWNRHDPD